MSDEYQKHLRSQLKHVLVSNWNNTEYIPVVPHYLIDNYVSICYVRYIGQDHLFRAVLNVTTSSIAK